MEEKHLMDRDSAFALLDYWVETLGLQDWSIVFKWSVPLSEWGMDTFGAVGDAAFVAEGKHGIVRILDERDWTHDEEDIEITYEEALVHELLHLKFALITPDSPDAINTIEYRVIHSLITDLARAFASTHRIAIDCYYAGMEEQAALAGDKDRIVQ